MRVLVWLGILCNRVQASTCVHGSLSAATHAPFHAFMVRPASQAGPMHESAGVGEVS